MDSVDSTPRKGEAGDSGEVAINRKNRVLDNEGGNAAPPTRKASSWEGWSHPQRASPQLRREPAPRHPGPRQARA